MDAANGIEALVWTALVDDVPIEGAAVRAQPIIRTFRIRVKSGHKAVGCAARARFVISPTIPRLARAAIFLWICRMLRPVDAASASISLTMRFDVDGRPRCFPRASAALMPAVTRR